MFLRIFCSVLVSVACFTVAYLLWAFMTYEWNPQTWSLDARVMMTLIAGPLSFGVGALVFLDNFWENRKWDKERRLAEKRESELRIYRSI